MNSVPIFGTEV